jgi:hypothetical protein
MAYGVMKSLIAFGTQIASTTGVIYTAPTGKYAEFNLIIHNTNSTSENVEIYLNGTADANRIIDITLTANETFEFAPKLPLVLAGSQTLQAKTTTASKVNIFVIGREET